MPLIAQLSRFCIPCSLIFMLGACSVAQHETPTEAASDLAGNYVPAAVIAQPIAFPQGEDVRQLRPEPGLSNASCGLNGAEGIEEEILRRVNLWRSQPRYCGSKLYPAVPPLRWNLKLQNASYHHAVEMARANLISHVSIDSRELRNRVRQAGYVFALVSENVAAGQSTVDAAMVSWQKSPDHCATMMGAKLEEVGVVCIHKPSSFYKYYWTMDLASPLLDPTVVNDQEKQEKKDKSKNHNPFLRVADEIKKF